MAAGTLDLARYYAGPDNDMVTTTMRGTDWRRQTWRQVGWLGIATNRVYSLGEDITSDPAGASPLWLLVENEHMPEAEDHTRG
jgi:hypothetical protein